MTSATPAQGGQRIRLGVTALAWLNLYQNLKQIVQDAIAPEIQSIKGDIRALETQVSALRTELRAFEDRTEKHFDQMNRQWELAIEVRERLATVEAQLKHR
jgi:flagellar capping protein FliD